ncbi:retinol dehydrogenase 12-like [Oppia nitens]|uniref:retinol dehydrogenase 12-like n=1 Tax=Oppia nitens TaxID=1686743 RepID=UPI0023DBC638|nr:retinol dehydrogenase 12-like [Oppia nitens]
MSLKSSDYRILDIVWRSVTELLQNAIGWRYKCTTNKQLDGQVVVITGANTGIGKETASDLAKRGAKVIIGCRDETRAANAIKDIKSKNPKADITAFKLDLSSLKSVREFAQQLNEKYQRIDILINNAGLTINNRKETEDGFEMMFGTNHLGHFLLTLLILPLLRKPQRARVVNVASVAYGLGKIDFDDIHASNKPYKMLSVYGQSKLANILFTREMARRLGTDSSINVYAVHPGCVRTEFARNLGNLDIVSKVFWLGFGHVFLINGKSGAQTSLYCAIDETLDNETGFYYENCHRNDDLYSKAKDDETAQRLWELSAQLVKLEDQYNLAKNPNYLK